MMAPDGFVNLMVLKFSITLPLLQINILLGNSLANFISLLIYP